VIVKKFTQRASMNESQDKRPRESGMRSAALLLSIPALLIVSPLVGLFAGMWLDRLTGWKPWLTALGVALGFAAAGRETYRIIRRVQAEEERDKRG
jgi:F0F1-type ATP synthase assembly protein I